MDAHPSLAVRRRAGCVFCDIIKGKQTAAVVYEDDSHVAFMDRSPITKGHILVLPKAHYETLFDLPWEDVAPLFRRVVHLASAVRKAMQADGMNIGQNNGRAAHQIVFHVHVHVIPRYRDDSPDGQWPVRRTASLEELERIADRIRPFVGRMPTS